MLFFGDRAWVNLGPGGGPECLLKCLALDTDPVARSGGLALSSLDTMEPVAIVITAASAELTPVIPESGDDCDMFPPGAAKGLGFTSNSTGTRH